MEKEFTSSKMEMAFSMYLYINTKQINHEHNPRSKRSFT